MGKKIKTLTPDDPRWQNFTRRLDGADEGCNCYFDDGDEFRWTCFNDFRFSRAILSSYDDVNVEETLAFFRQNGGHCDCEILFNVEQSSSEMSHELGMSP